MAKEKPLSTEEAERLVSQVQTAHRVAAAFYARILPTLDEVANQLGLGFCYWSSEDGIGVPRGGTQASHRPVWDFLPLFVSSHCYQKLNGKGASPDDIGLALVIYVDSNFDPDGPLRKGKRTVPDPVTLEFGMPVLRAYVYRPTQKTRTEFQSLWNDTPWVECTGEWIPDKKVEMKGVGLELPLSEVITNPQSVVDRLRQYCN